MVNTSNRTVKWSSRIATVAAAVALSFGSAANANAAPQLLLNPDLVAQQSQPQLVAHVNPSAPPVMFARVENRALGNARASTASISLRPVTQILINGQIRYLDAIGRPAVTGTDAVTPIAGFGSDNNVVLQLTANPDAGLYRVTVCADSAATVHETNETNNCSTTVTELTHQYYG